MLKNILSQLSYDQKKEIGKYALIFSSGAITGFLIKSSLDSFFKNNTKENTNLSNLNKEYSNLDDDVIDEKEDII